VSMSMICTLAPPKVGGGRLGSLVL
jgi:hypothetical protein